MTTNNSGVATQTTNSYSFATFDMRPTPEARAANEQFATHPSLGIEVTVPALAELCSLGNLDPQHAGQNSNQAAIESALVYPLPPAGSHLVTVRADLDAIGAMSVLAMRLQARQDIINADRDSQLFGCDPESWTPGPDIMGRVELVAKLDKFARGGYPGPQPLPTENDPWCESTASAGDSRQLAAIAAAVMDFKVSMADRVAMMTVWLQTGQEPAGYREKVELARRDMVRALESGEIKHRIVAEGRIAVVESTHASATQVGYAFAPVVVAINPQFRFGASAPHRKLTICAFAPKHADIRSALAELSTLEPGWGGSPTIGGSPQGVSSALSVEQVVEVLTKHLN